MKVYKLHSYAKINLNLNVIKKLKNKNLHAIESLVVFINLSDLIEIKRINYHHHRVVFQGNNVVNESWETALFQNMGSSPATMEAGKICDMVGCYPENDTEQADANQAYVQARSHVTTV